MCLGSCPINFEFSYGAVAGVYPFFCGWNGSLDIIRNFVFMKLMGILIRASSAAVLRCYWGRHSRDSNHHPSWKSLALSNLVMLLRGDAFK